MTFKRKRTRRIYVRNSRHSRPKMSLPLAVILGFTPLVAYGIDLFKTQGVNGLKQLPTTLVPYNPVTHKFDTSMLGYGLWPILTGIAVHKFVGGMLGVNAALARARVPLLRI